MCCVVWVFEHNANRCWVSHGGTETRSLGFVAASCGSLSTEPIEAEFHTEARSLGPVLCGGKASVSPWLRVSKRVVRVFEHNANRCRFSHGVTELRYCSVRWMSLRVFASPCE